MNKNEIVNILKQYKQDKAEEYGIRSIGLFGSYALNCNREDSDIDVVVETHDPDVFTLVHIKEELEQRFHTSVDVVRFREKMNPFLKKRIERDAVHV